MAKESALDIPVPESRVFTITVTIIDSRYHKKLIKAMHIHAWSTTAKVTNRCNDCIIKIKAEQM